MINFGGKNRGKRLLTGNFKTVDKRFAAGRTLDFSRCAFLIFA